MSDVTHQFEAKSSNVGWARYRAADQAMQVDFKNSKGEYQSTYEYSPVSASDWQSFQQAKSHGQHFAAHIRNAKDAHGKPKFKAVRIK